MRDLVRSTWLPTALFTAATLPLVLNSIRCGPALAFGPALTASVVVPAAWHWYVIGSDRPSLRRAALAGASASYVIVTLSHVVVGVRFSLTHSWSSLELGALAVGLEDLFVTVGGLLIGAPIGALLGVLIAHIQRAHWTGPPALAEGSVGTRRSALTAIMISILLSPVLAYLALASNQESLGALASKYSMGYSAALAATWVVCIPLAAVLGARRALAVLVTRRSWIPAMVLFAPAVVIGSAHGGRWAVWSGITSVVLAPLIWSEAVRRGDRTVTQRGAAAGASIELLAQIVPAVVATLWFVILRATAPNSGGEPGGPTNPVASFFWLTAILAALVGAALGAVVARQPTWSDAPSTTAHQSG